MKPSPKVKILRPTVLKHHRVTELGEVRFWKAECSLKCSLSAPCNPKVLFEHFTRCSERQERSQTSEATTLASSSEALCSVAISHARC